MQNLIVINDNIKYIQNIIEEISDSIDNIKLYNFYNSENVNNIINKIDNRKLDILIVTFNENFNKILNYFIKNDIDYYKKSIIIIYDNLTKLNDSLNQENMKYIFRCVKYTNISSLVKSLRKLVYIKENTYEKASLHFKIEQELLKIGFSKRNSGTQYLLEIIEYVYINKIEKFKLNDIYDILSKKHKKSYCSIKGAIRLAKDIMCQYGNENIILDYFNYLQLEDYPTVKEIIATIIEKL